MRAAEGASQPTFYRWFHQSGGKVSHARTCFPGHLNGSGWLTVVLKIIYIGSSGPLSLIPLQRLLDCGQAVVAVALEADDEPVLQDQRIPLLTTNHGSVASLARLHGIPLIELSRPWVYSVDEMGRYAPDLIVVSCFARKLPESVLSIPHIGCFNLHPSLLPAYRGPVPLFWQFRAGVKTFGITLHRMSSRLDAGNIVAQTGVCLLYTSQSPRDKQPHLV